MLLHTYRIPTCPLYSKQAANEQTPLFLKPWRKREKMQKRKLWSRLITLLLAGAVQALPGLGFPRKETANAHMYTQSGTDSSVSLIAWEGWGSEWCENAATAAMWQLSLKTAVVSIHPPVLWNPLQPVFNFHCTADSSLSFSFSSTIYHLLYLWPYWPLLGFLGTCIFLVQYFRLYYIQFNFKSKLFNLKFYA